MLQRTLLKNIGIELQNFFFEDEIQAFSVVTKGKYGVVFVERLIENSKQEILFGKIMSTFTTSYQEVYCLDKSYDFMMFFSEIIANYVCKFSLTLKQWQQQDYYSDNGANLLVFADINTISINYDQKKYLWEKMKNTLL